MASLLHRIEFAAASRVPLTMNVMDVLAVNRALNVLRRVADAECTNAKREAGDVVQQLAEIAG